MAARNAVPESSSLNPGISTVISTQDESPFRLSSPSLASPSSTSSSSPSPPSRYTVSSPARCAVLSTSAFTPTMASVPSAKHILALPLVPGRMPVSATRGRNWAGERPSGRMGGVRESESCRYANSAGERRTCWLDAMSGSFAVLSVSPPYCSLLGWAWFVLSWIEYWSCCDGLDRGGGGLPCYVGPLELWC